jgi:hypothetical protein
MRLSKIIPCLCAGGAVLLAAPAGGNVRAPWRFDGFASGAVDGLQVSRAVILSGERMVVALPTLSDAPLPTQATISFVIRYEFENRLPQPVSFVARFIAVDILEPSAEVNGHPLRTAVIEDPDEKAECLIQIARHRSAFLPEFYGSSLVKVREAAGAGAAEGGAWLSRLQPDRLRTIPFRSIFYRTGGDPPGLPDFPAVELPIVLQPGKNTLAVTYQQRLFIEERGQGYFASWPRKGVAGFDYLLYPAQGWILDPAFRLDLRIEVPDYRTAFLIFPSWKRPAVKCNLPLRGEDGPDGRRRIYRGDFAGIPADVLTFLFWLDEDAARYLK